jgi:CysZ protein
VRSSAPASLTAATGPKRGMRGHSAVAGWRCGVTVAGVADLVSSRSTQTSRRALPAPVKAAGGPGRDFFTGVMFLLRGLGMYARSPRLMLLGVIPALISAVVIVSAVVLVVYFSGDLANLMTPYAQSWAPGLRDMLRALIVVALVVVVAVLAVLVYAALTLLIGEPFYEAISNRVEDRLGGVPGAVHVPMGRMIRHSLVDSVRLFIFTLLCGVPLFLGGLIPVVGETVVPALTALVGSWVLALELTGVAFERRGLRYVHRRQVLRQRRSLALGFGLTTFVCFLIPLGAVLVMPAAVAGATLMTRHLYGLPTSSAQ